MESTGRLPDDPALPALEAIRIEGLARAFPELELDNDPVELRLCNYVAGSRATFEARVGDAKEATKELVRTQPAEKPRQLVHGTLYARHILDLGDGPGVIDWQQFGQGPVEVDAGMFLATISRLAFRHPDVAVEAARAEETFMARTRGLVDVRIVNWYRAAGLLHLAGSGLKTGLRRSVPTPEAHALVAEASRRAELLMGSHPILLAEAPTTFARIRSIFTARPRVPGLVQPAVPMAKVGPDPN